MNATLGLKYNGNGTFDPKREKEIKKILNKLKEGVVNQFELIDGSNISEVASNTMGQTRPLTTSPRGGLTSNIAENVLRVMESTPILKGSIRNHERERQHILDDITYFVKQAVPVKFIFLGYPFKNPNILSTLRTHPDLGELAMIRQLHNINAAIRLVYTPGATFEILSESFDYKHRDVFLDSRERSSAAADGLKNLIFLTKSEYTIVPKDLFNLTNRYREFDSILEEEISKLTQAIESGNPDNETLHLLQRTMHNSLDSGRLIAFLLENTDKEPTLQLLIDIDNDAFDHITNGELIKKYKQRETIELTLRYQAYHRARSRLNIIPDYIKKQGGVYLVVREHEHRLGFRLMEKGTHYFSHHGMPVLDTRSHFVQIVRVKDILEKKSEYTGIMCSDDLDGTIPYYFIRKE